jgi:hypothetical protein
VGVACTTTTGVAVGKIADRVGVGVATSGLSVGVNVGLRVAVGTGPVVAVGSSSIASTVGVAVAAAGPGPAVVGVAVAAAGRGVEVASSPPQLTAARPAMARIRTGKKRLYSLNLRAAANTNVLLIIFFASRLIGLPQ